MTPQLVVFARAPRYGAVKTRLARNIGPAQALAVHWELLTSALRSARASGLPCRLLLDGELDDRQRRRLRAWLPDEIEQQICGDLGARMAAAFESAGAPVLLMGSDCPDIDARYLQQAARQLALADVVIGPAEDGGYGLIGLRSPAPELFRDMPWSTDRVAAETLARARALGLRVRQLELLWDVDTVADWRRWRELSGRRPR